MSPKILVMLGMTLGSSIGGYIPAMWGGDIFSFSSLFGSLVGGIIGALLGFKISSYLD